MGERQTRDARRQKEAAEEKTWKEEAEKKSIRHRKRYEKGR